MVGKVPVSPLVILLHLRVAQRLVQLWNGIRPVSHQQGRPQALLQLGETRGSSFTSLTWLGATCTWSINLPGLAGWQVSAMCAT